MSAPASSEAFFEAVETRRSYYQLSNKSTISDDQLKALVERSVKHAPNSFNMQESRAIVVTGEHHQKLWDVVTETYKKTLGGDADQEAFWKNKIDSAYRPGYGTVLFFEDDAVVKGWQEKMPPLASAFTVWSDNAAGILQYIVWTALAKEGLGASLQHFGQYSAETQEEVQKLFHVPASWRSTGMMPFGVPAGPTGNGAHPKEFLPLEDRVKTFFG